MSENPQRQAYLDAQIESIHRNLRFLEVVATSPIGLVTDLKSLREALPVGGASEERDRQAFLDLTGRGKDPRQAGLKAQALISETLDLITVMTPEGEAALSPEFIGRATKVLDRVADRLGGDSRKETAQAIEGLYVIIDPEHTDGRPVLEVAEATLSGGAAAVQLRDKSGARGKLLETARRMQEMCAKTGAVFIINDWVDIARLANTDGVHVGQKDIPVADTRSLLSLTQIIGTSNALLQEALDSESKGADYIAVGAMFETSTKTDTRPAGVETLRQVKGSVGAPVIAIGGINESNIEQIAEAGADSACVATAVTKAKDPEAATRKLVELFGGAR